MEDESSNIAQRNIIVLRNFLWLARYSFNIYCAASGGVFQWRRADVPCTYDSSLEEYRFKAHSSMVV